LGVNEGSCNLPITNLHDPSFTPEIFCVSLVENENQKEKQNESKKAFMLLNQKLDSENVGESKCI